MKSPVGSQRHNYQERWNDASSYCNMTTSFLTNSGKITCLPKMAWAIHANQMPHETQLITHGKTLSNKNQWKMGYLILIFTDSVKYTNSTFDHYSLPTCVNSCSICYTEATVLTFKPINLIPQWFIGHLFPSTTK